LKKGIITSSAKSFFVVVFTALMTSVLSAEVLLHDDFSTGASKWSLGPAGNWGIVKGAIEGKKDFAVCRNTDWDNYKLTLQARSSEGGVEGQIWVSFRFVDEWNRYALAIRGGLLNELILFRYNEGDFPNPDVMCLKSRPLDFKFEAVKWYDIRIVCIGEMICVWVGDSKDPQIEVTDAKIKNGGIALGGGYLKCQYRNVKVEKIDKVDDFRKQLQLVQSKAAKTERLKNEQAHREKVRIEQRSKYKPVIVKDMNVARNEIDLCGKWLFMPDQNISDEAKAALPDFNDMNWHIMDVPNFWNQIAWWNMNSGQFGLRGQDEVFRYAEAARTKGYTFDADATTAAWYRQWLVFPDKATGKRYTITFDASASITAVYFNGVKVGEHIGFSSPFECDITDHIKWGHKNLLAVFVNSGASKGPAKVVGIAVTMEVTDEMLNSLPMGNYNSMAVSSDYEFTRLPRPAGLWQPVRMTVTSPVKIDDVFWRPRLDGGAVEVTINNPDRKDFEGKAVARIAGISIEQIVKVAANSDTTVKIDIPVKNPKLWSPEKPNLYDLTIELKSGSKVLDCYTCTTGFRKFEARDGKFFLNGVERWMGGGNTPPHGIKPNDAKLANEFFRLMHDGNQWIVRSHYNPFTKAWLDAADRQGVAVSIEDTWPWIGLIGNPMPDKKLCELWRAETREIMRSLRNHPSVVIWTIGNEFKWNRHAPSIKSGVFLEKMRILSEWIKEIRQIHPDIPVCAWSDYYRENDLYKKQLKPNNIDDGDITDPHWYGGWYNPSYFMDSMYGGKYIPEYAGQPIISQETSTGYASNDTGSAQRMYTQIYVPQTWIGDDAYEHRDPMTFLNYNAMLTKEGFEDVRRTRKTAGWMMFSNVCWFKYASSAEHIKPFPVYYQAKLALAPVLISLDQRDRHYFAGSKITGNLVMINDDLANRSFKDIRCTATLRQKLGNILAKETVKLPDCSYYGKSQQHFAISIPAKVPFDRQTVYLKLELFAKDEKIGENSYDILIMTKESTLRKFPNQSVALNGVDEEVKNYLGLLNLNLITDSNSKLTGMDLVIIGKGNVPSAESAKGKQLLNYVNDGGTIILLETCEAGKLLLAELAIKTVNAEVEFVNIQRFDHPLFAGFDSQDFRWWNGNGKSCAVALTSYIIPDNKAITKLCQNIPIHGYNLDWSVNNPIFIYTKGKGKILVCEVRVSACGIDPLAAKLLSNMVQWCLVGRK